MAIPGSYHPPNETVPAPGTTPTPTPTSTPGGGSWWERLFGTANLPDWLRTMLQNRAGGQAGVGGWPTGENASGWWGDADALAKIKAMLPGTLPDLRAHGPRMVDGQWTVDPSWRPVQWQGGGTEPAQAPHATVDYWKAKAAEWGRPAAPVAPVAVGQPGLVETETGNRKWLGGPRPLDDPRYKTNQPASSAYFSGGGGGSGAAGGGTAAASAGGGLGGTSSGSGLGWLARYLGG